MFKKDNNFKFLEFRTELINLLNKYHYEISGTGLDDGSINIEDLINNKIFILRDSFSNYEALDNSWDELPINYILNIFPDEVVIKSEKINVGILTNDYMKCFKLLDEIARDNKENIKYFKRGKEFQELVFLDGTKYKWVKPINSSRGYKFSKAYIDKNLTLDELWDIVQPICIHCSKKDIDIF